MANITRLTAEAWRRIGGVLDRIADLGAGAQRAALEEACRAEGASVADVEPFLTALRQSENFLERVNPAVVEQSIKALADDGTQTVVAGTRIGPYEVLEILGAGGMGEVYKARDTRLNRLVAIKRVALHLADHADARERLEREARAISALSHPHICTLFDVAAHDGVEVLVMELVDGETLDARLRRGPLAIAEALEYGAQIAEALAAAHEHGIVHRDLKPANVMLTRHGVKLLDFGLAAFRLSSEKINVADTALTKQGTIAGTLRYMAPERLQAKETSERVDIFALGAMLHEMLTGRPAFEADNPAAVVAAVLERDPPSVSSQREAVPSALEWTIRRCLAKRVHERWQSAGDLAGHLRWIAASASVVARERKNTRSRWVAFASVAAGVAVGGLAAGLMFIGTRSPQAPTQTFRYEIPPPEGTAFERLFALSPDGRRIAFTASEPDGQRTIWIRPLDALASQSIPGTDGAFYPFWSPDARFIGFFADDKLKKVELATGNIEVISEAGLGGGGTWNAEGTILFSPQSTTGPAVLHRVSASGGAPVPVTAFDGRLGLHAWPQFLPDGRHYLYRRTEVDGLSGVFLSRLDSSEYQPVLAAPTPSRPDGGVDGLENVVGRATYTDGHLFYVRAGSLFAQRFDIDRRELVGDPVHVADDVFQDGPGRAAFDVSSGVLAYRTRVPSGFGQLTWLDREGRDVGRLADPDAYASPALSPDGRSVLAGRLRTPPQIVRIDVERGTATPVAERGGLPAWSPRGERFAFRGGRGGAPLVSIAPADGSDPGGELLGPLMNAWPGDWSREDNVLIGTAIRAETSSWDLFTVPVGTAGRASFPVASRFDEGDPRLSPDGRWLAYAVKDDSRQWELYVRPFGREGGAVRISRNGGRHPRWRADGRELFYVNADEAMVQVTVKEGEAFEVLASAVLFRHSALGVGYDADFASPYDVDPDGQRFLVKIPAQEVQPGAISIILNWPAVLMR